jgi:hypothetical protein
MVEDSSFFQTVYKEPFLYRRAIHSPILSLYEIDVRSQFRYNFRN